MAQNYRKVIEFKTVGEFSEYLKSENISIGLTENIPTGGKAALAQKIQYKDRTTHLSDLWNCIHARYGVR